MYAIYSLTQIRSLSDAGRFVEAWGIGHVTYTVAESVLRSGGLAFVLTTVVLDMPNDQGAKFNEDRRRNAIIADFLDEHFKWSEIADNFEVVHRQAEILLFETPPFDMINILHQQEMFRENFERCMNQTYAPPAAGVEAAEAAYNKALETCYEQTGYRPASESLTCTEFGCTPARAP